MIIKDIVFRNSIESDLDEIVEIYNQAIRSRVATGDLKEYSPESRKQWFRQFQKNDYPLIVAEYHGKVLAYSYLSPYRKGRDAMKGIAEISFFVDYSYHGNGIGSRLLEFSIHKSREIGKENLIAILMSVNIRSIKMLRKFGFEQWACLPQTIKIDDNTYDHLIYGLKL